MKTVLIIGLGVSGKSAAAFLRRQGCRVLIADKRTDLGPEVLPDSPSLPLDGIDQVIISPGILPTHPLIQKAKLAGIEVIGEIELAFRYIQNRCVGITGTNGKTTTVLLVTHVLNHAGMKARALGNVGEGLAAYLLDPDPLEILVVELSSYQLDTLDRRCLDAAVLLNITPDHLDRYKTMQAYAASKQRIEKCLKEGATLWISKQVSDEYGDLFQSKPKIFDLEPSDRGFAEKNIQAAFAACSPFGVSLEAFCKALESFRKPPHRIEWVAEIQGVAYYNDSKATNIDSVVYAMTLFKGPVVLLAGGVDKGASYSPWIEAFGSKVKQIIAYGQAAPLIEKELAGSFAIKRVETLADAVEMAAKIAKEKECVLLSPGCSSFDQFKNYEHRGNEFKRLVLEIGEKS